MSLHDEFERAGEARTRGSAERLTGADVRTLLDARVRRGRRRRDAGIGTVAAVAVGAIALGVANVPGWGGEPVAPASTPSGIEPTPGGDYEFAEPAFDLAATPQLECGVMLDISAPVVIHDESVLERQLMAHATLEVDDVVRAGDDVPMWFAQSLEGPGDEQLMWRTATAVVRGNGEVVGAAPGAGWSGDGHPVNRVEGEDDAEAPLPGQCEPPAAQLDGVYTQVYVVQVAEFHKSKALATFFFTEEVTYEGLAQYWKDQGVTFGEAPIEPTAYPEPRGEVYTAYLVPRPDVESCTPLTDQRAEGHPGLASIQYDVTIPGVQPLTGELWGNAFAAIIEDEDYDAWYVGLPQAITADEVSAGDPVATVGWKRSAALTLGSSLGAEPLDLPTRDDCAFVQPIPEISGSVFLVIDGADWDTLEQQFPGADFNPDSLTWVYLGEAE